MGVVRKGDGRWWCEGAAKDAPRARDRHKHAANPADHQHDGPSRQRHAKLQHRARLGHQGQCRHRAEEAGGDEEGLRDDGGRDLEHHVPVETGAHRPAQQRCVRE